MQRSVLVIEDDQDLSELISIHLSDISCDVSVSSNGGQGLARALENNYDLILLDLGLPEVEGLEICRRVRNAGKNCFILMLTSRSSELDRVVGLELGADDYLTKPFSFRELQARVKALLRRLEKSENSQAPVDEATILCGPLVIEVGKRTVKLNGAVADLTAKEFELLVYLARRPGHVYSRAHLLKVLWGESFSGYEHTVNSHINRLRTKIEVDPSRPVHVLTVRGAGYKFFNDVTSTSSVRE